MNHYALTKKHDALLSIEALQAGINHYLKDGVQADDPRVSPLFDDLKGLPPTLVQVGSKEILLDDSKRFREKAEKLESKYTLNFTQACGIISRCSMHGSLKQNRHWRILRISPIHLTVTKCLNFMQKWSAILTIVILNCFCH